VPTTLALVALYSISLPKFNILFARTLSAFHGKLFASKDIKLHLFNNTKKTTVGSGLRLTGKEGDISILLSGTGERKQG